MRTAGISIIRIDGEDVNSVGPLLGKQRTETAHRARGNAVKHLLSGTCVIPCSQVGPNPASGRVNQGLGTTQKRFSMLRPRPALRRGDEGLTTHRDQFSNPGSIGVNRLLISVAFVSGKAPAAGESTAILVLLPAAGALPLTKSTIW